MRYWEFSLESSGFVTVSEASDPKFLEQSQQGFQVWCDRLLLQLQFDFGTVLQQMVSTQRSSVSPHEDLFAIVVDYLSVHFIGHWSLRPIEQAVSANSNPVNSAQWVVCWEDDEDHFVHPVPSYVMTLKTIRDRFFTQLNHLFTQQVQVLTGIQVLQSDRGVLYQELEELKQVNQLKSEFLANTSHEIRTPLSSILGFTHLLREQGFNPGAARHQEYLRIILTSGQHLLALINDILDLSKIEANQLDLNREIVEIPTLCNAIMTLVQEKANTRGLQLQLEIEPNAKHFFCDPLRVKQMLFNLLSNALKFTNRGTVGLRVSQDDQATTFTVWDTGMGIPPEQFDLIFRPYQQLPNTPRSIEGTGLGLALTQKLAELHQGSVSVNSTVNQGSSFQVKIPRINSVLASSLSSPRMLFERGETTEAILEGGEMRSSFPRPFVPVTGSVGRVGSGVRPILLVEDSRDNAQLIVAYLCKYGHAVTWVSHAKDFWSALQTERPALILMDVNLPQVDGLTLIRQLRSDARYQDLPVIVQTALAMSGDRELCLAAGATEYMTKPLNLKQLVARVNCYSEAQVERGSSEWRVESGELRVESGELRVEN